MSKPVAVLRGMDLALAAMAAIVLIYLGNAAFQDVAVSESDATLVQTSVEATLVSADGAIRRRSNASLAWRGVATGAELRAGDGVFVPDGGAASIRLSDSSVLSLGPRTLVVIRRSVVKLSKGDLVAEAGANSQLTIDSGGVIVELAGNSVASVGRTKDRGSVVESVKGQVTVVGQGPRQKKTNPQQLAPGETTARDASGAKAKGAVQATIVLASPSPGHRLIFAKKQPETNFRWKPVPGCTTYEVRFASRAEGHRSGSKPTLRNITVSKDFLATHALPVGEVHWSVSCKNSQGVSYQSRSRSLFVSSNTAPVPYHPANDADVLVADATRLSLAWTRLVNVSRYRVELAAGKRFSAPIVAEEVSTSFHDVQTPLSEGAYCLRVKGIAPDRGEMPWSTPRCFQVIRRPRIGAPRLLDATFEPIRPAPAGAP